MNELHRLLELYKRVIPQLILQVSHAAFHAAFHRASRARPDML